MESPAIHDTGQLPSFGNDSNPHPLFGSRLPIALALK
jgi:hypothetical protein